MPLTGLTGSRDPYEIIGDGAGFVLCWSGRPRLQIGFENEQKELLQIESDEMLLAIPECVLSIHTEHAGLINNSFSNSASRGSPDGVGVLSYSVGPRKYRKVVSNSSSLVLQMGDY
jgi:hypothetical protein